MGSLLNAEKNGKKRRGQRGETKGGIIYWALKSVQNKHKKRNVKMCVRYILNAKEETGLKEKTFLSDTDKREVEEREVAFSLMWSRFSSSPYIAILTSTGLYLKQQLVTSFWPKSRTP